MRWKLICGTFVLSVVAGIYVLSSASALGNNSLHLPRPDHVVIVIEENHSYSQIIESPEAPYINRLAAQGAVFTQSFGVTYPSKPNYLALFSGSTQGITDNTCPHTLTTPNLGHALLAAGLTFAGYSEDLPSVGSLICSAGDYARKHNPWVNWQDSPDHGIPATTNHHLEGYVQWAQQHNSLLVVTWDEDNKKEHNRIATLFVGPMVHAGHYDQRINHYNVLRTIEDLYGLAHSGASAEAVPITQMWKVPPRP
ncbi:MAG: acid phosphatase [Nitrospirae bacterium]|nr:acid phosphatase [Nitrospirota bacterium]